MDSYYFTNYYNMVGTKKIKKYYGHKRFYELIETMKTIHSNKNYNYAKDGDPLSNLRASEQFDIPGWKGTLVRITDKYARIIQLASGKEDKVGESIKDTLLDLAIYSILDIILYEEYEKKGKI